MSFVAKSIFAAVLFSATALSSPAASAETIFGALAKAYQLNSTLNFGTRRRPRHRRGRADRQVRLSSDDRRQRKHRLLVQRTVAGLGDSRPDHSASRSARCCSTASRPGTTSAPPKRRCGHRIESLRNTEQNTLFDAASAYMDVIRDRQIAVLTEQQSGVPDRAGARRALALRGRRGHAHRRRPGRRQPLGGRRAARRGARAGASRARQSIAQIVGEEPGKLQAGSPLAKMLPESLEQAIAIAAGDHPAILATEHLVDAAAFPVKSIEGALLPQVSATAGVSRGLSATPMACRASELQPMERSIPPASAPR